MVCDRAVRRALRHASTWCTTFSRIDSSAENEVHTSKRPASNPGCDGAFMIYDLTEVKGSLKPLPIAALDTVMTLVIATEIMIFDGYRQLGANTGDVSESREPIPAPPEWRARAALRC